LKRSQRQRKRKREYGAWSDDEEESIGAIRSWPTLYEDFDQQIRKVIALSKREMKENGGKLSFGDGRASGRKRVPTARLQEQLAQSKEVTSRGVKGKTKIPKAKAAASASKGSISNKASGKGGRGKKSGSLGDGGDGDEEDVEAALGAAMQAKAIRATANKRARRNTALANAATAAAAREAARLAALNPNITINPHRLTDEQRQLRWDFNRQQGQRLTASVVGAPATRQMSWPPPGHSFPAGNAYPATAPGHMGVDGSAIQQQHNAMLAMVEHYRGVYFQSTVAQSDAIARRVQDSPLVTQQPAAMTLPQLLQQLPQHNAATAATAAAAVMDLTGDDDEDDDVTLISSTPPTGQQGVLSADQVQVHKVTAQQLAQCTAYNLAKGASASAAAEAAAMVGQNPGFNGYYPEQHQTYTQPPAPPATYGGGGGGGGSGGSSGGAPAAVADPADNATRANTFLLR
jgi:hypothetical protein